MTSHKTPDYSVIIINYNGEDLIEKCISHTLQSIKSCTEFHGELIVVDNGSTDQSRNILEKFNSVIKVLLLNENIIMGAYNKGAEIAEGRYLMMLNNDQFIDPDCLQNSIRPLDKNPELFQVCIQDLNESDRSYQSGKGAGELKKGQIWLSFTPENPDKSDFVMTGGLGIYRAGLFRQLGGFCRLFHPFYWEDADLAYNAWKQGYKVWYEATAKAEHRHQATISRFKKEYVRRINRRNKILFFWLNVSSPKIFIHHLCHYPLFAWEWYKKTGEIDYLLIPFILLCKLHRIIPEKIRRLQKTCQRDEYILNKEYSTTEEPTK